MKPSFKLPRRKELCINLTQEEISLFSMCHIFDVLENIYIPQVISVGTILGLFFICDFSTLDTTRMLIDSTLHKEQLYIKPSFVPWVWDS